MELFSSIDKTWKLCTFWSLVFCLILFFRLSPTQDKASLSATADTMAESAHLEQLVDPYNTLFKPPKPKPKPKPKPESMPEPEARNCNVVQAEAHPKISNNTTEKQMKNESGERCNMFDGSWVYKAEEIPPYNSNTCPFLEEKMSCQKNGRPDSEYEKWSWEARDCDIPVFNGRDMLERVRNKRMIIVGDSLNRNQWESLACLLYSTIPPSRAEVDAEGAEYKVLKAKDYDFIMEFYWSPFLIKLDQKHESGSKVLVLDKLSANSNEWGGADIMVFNSGHWWTHPGKLRSWELFEYEGKLVEHMPVELAYERGMNTWASWIETNVNPKKTTVFFRSVSPDHTGQHWCYNSTQPIIDESYKSTFPKPLIDIIEGLTKGMSKSQVKYLNITKLSEYRKDAHPSLYRTSKWKIYTEKYQRLIPSLADCSHWCLPGLPDTWNRLLYASLLNDKSGNSASNFAIEDTNAETNSEYAVSNQIQKPAKKSQKKCNFFKGRWVYKPDQKPSYNATRCPFIDKKVNCRKNGRPDSEYEKWRWEAKDCDIPLFDGRDMLERLRNKRIIIVGDSISRSQWESLACLLFSSVIPSTAEVKNHGHGHLIFKAKEYNCTVEFDWNPFLVELNNKHESGKRVLVLDQISSTSDNWRGADVMVFNSGFWWNHPPQSRAWDVFQCKGQLVEKMPAQEAFKRGMKTWARWMENNINPRETTVFYRSMSAEHYGKHWCYNSTQPMTKDSNKSRLPSPMIKAVERLIKGMSRSQVKYFDITNLSNYRIDAHPSIYRNMEWKNVTMSSMPNADCSHWCLPGLPDTWNTLLYASLFFDYAEKMSNS